MKFDHSREKSFRWWQMLVDFVHLLAFLNEIRDVVFRLPRSQLTRIPLHKISNHELSFHEFTLFIPIYIITSSKTIALYQTLNKLIW